MNAMQSGPAGKRNRQNKPGGKHSPAKAKHGRDQVQALKLRIEGYSYREIAEKLKYANESVPRRMVKTALEAAAELSKDLAEDMREIERQRLDALLKELWADFKEATDIDVRRKIAETIIKLAARRSALEGLDAAEKKEISGPNGQPVLNLAQALLALTQAEEAGGGEG